MANVNADVGVWEIQEKLEADCLWECG